MTPDDLTAVIGIALYVLGLTVCALLPDNGADSASGAQ